jgi:hypothetical protein
MTPKRIYFGLIGMIFALFIGLLAGTYGINSLLSSRADKLTQLKAKSQALDQEQLSLANAKKEVAKYSSLQQTAQSIVPEDKDQAEAVREIVKIAAANNISLASVTFPASTLGGSSASSSSGVGVSTPSASAVSNPNAGKLSQLLLVKNIPSVYSLQITVQSDPNKPVSYASFINFLNDLEHNRRTAQISSISLQPNTNNPNLLTFTLVLNEYIKP